MQRKSYKTAHFVGWLVDWKTLIEVHIGPARNNRYDEISSGHFY
jgi:hypothetical protein